MLISSEKIHEILKLPDKASKLRDLFSDFPESTIYKLCKDFDPKLVAEIVMALGRPLGVLLFEKFKLDQQRKILSEFRSEWEWRILSAMSSDKRKKLKRFSE